MSDESTFFKESDTTLGVFYPNHYVIAVFRDRNTAQQVHGTLRSAGFSAEDVIALDGKEFVELVKPNTGVAASIMQTLARFLSTEQRYADYDLMHARQGASFLAAYCPTEALKDQAWGIVKPAEPLDARYYSRAGIEHMAGDPPPG